jgi:hypothetical protein
MSQYGVNVPKGFAISSLTEISDALKQNFPTDEEVCIWGKTQ